MQKIVSHCVTAISVSAIVPLVYIAGVLAQGKTAGSGPELAFNDYCRECHAFDKGDNRLGPSLYGVFGRKAGSVAGFDYSISLKSSNITWNEKTLDQWIADPNALIPGNNMGSVFSGVPDAATRAEIIAFLKQDTHTQTQK
jgi:cytochrome c